MVHTETDHNFRHASRVNETELKRTPPVLGLENANTSSQMPQRFEFEPERGRRPQPPLALPDFVGLWTRIRGSDTPSGKCPTH